MLLSAVVPGAGQVYNGSYWKTPIIAGFGIYFISEWISNNNRVVDYRNQGNTALRDFYKKQRDTFTWYFTILYLLNVADAYVDAALYGFNVSDDLSIRFLPGQGDRVACMRMQISF